MKDWLIQKYGTKAWDERLIEYVRDTERNIDLSKCMSQRY